MAIMRVEKNNNYTVMVNHHLRDKQLSLKAKGLLSVMISLPPERASLLVDRYFEGKKNSQICSERFITERHLRRLMNEAVHALQEVLNHEAEKHG